MTLIQSYFQPSVGLKHSAGDFYIRVDHKRKVRNLFRKDKKLFSVFPHRYEQCICNEGKNPGEVSFYRRNLRLICHRTIKKGLQEFVSSKSGCIALSTCKYTLTQKEIWMPRRERTPVVF